MDRLRNLVLSEEVLHPLLLVDPSLEPLLWAEVHNLEGGLSLAAAPNLEVAPSSEVLSLELAPWELAVAVSLLERHLQQALSLDQDRELLSQVLLVALR